MAPSPLEVIVPFVNTLDLESGVDEIATPAALGSWLRDHAQLDRHGVPSPGDVRRAARLREALRAHLSANDGAPLLPAAVVALDRQARRSRVRVVFGPSGAEVRASAGGVDGALGAMLAAVAVATAAGTWTRYKACRADACRWAFVDRSRNGSRHWCAMGVCGNREKVRAFRARASAEG